MRRLEQLDDWEAIRRTILALNHQGLRAPRIADRLNHEGWRTPRGQPFTGDRVRHWLSREGKTAPRRSRGQDHCCLGPDEWFIPDLARHLRISHSTIRAWIQRGRIHARQVEGRYSRWVVKADEAILRRCMGRRNPSP